MNTIVLIEFDYEYLREWQTLKNNQTMKKLKRFPQFRLFIWKKLRKLFFVLSIRNRIDEIQCSQQLYIRINWFSKVLST